jgi:hypothetical protein
MFDTVKTLFLQFLTVFFKAWPGFDIPSPREYGTTFLSLKTGAGKTLRYPIQLVQQHGGKCFVVVPQQIHVRNNMNFHISNEDLTKQGILVQGIFRQYNKWTLGKRGGKNGKTTLFNQKPNGKFRGEVCYITAGSMFRRLLSGSIKLDEINYLMLDEVHVTENDYCTLLMTINEIVKRTKARQMPQIILSSATLNNNVMDRLGPVLEKLQYMKAVEIKNDETPYKIDTKFKPFITLEEITEFMSEKTNEAVSAWFRQGGQKRYNFEGSEIQPGILLHLPGKNECHEVGQAIYNKLSGVTKDGVRISYIYSGSEDVVELYNRDEEPIFNVIIATNADSGVTLPVGITIDSGLKKHPICYNNEEGNEVWSLRPVQASKSEMVQRRGRVGRTGDGIAYHCLSEEQFNAAPEHTDPDTFKGENLEMVLAIIDAGYYFDQTLYHDLPSHIQRLMDLDLLTEDATDVFAQVEIGEPHKHTTEIGQQVAKIPLPVLWGKMIVEAPFNLKHGILCTATFFAIQKQGGFLRGKTKPADFQKRRKLMGNSQMDFIHNLWMECEAINTRERGHYKVAKEIAQEYSLDYKSLVQWKNDFLEICGRVEIHTDISKMEFEKKDVEKYISISLLLDGILLGTLDADLATVYSDGCKDLAYKDGGMSITNYTPSGSAIVTDQIVHYVTADKKEVYTSSVWFKINKEIIDALKTGDIPMAVDFSDLPEDLQHIYVYLGLGGANSWFTLSDKKLGRMQGRIYGLFKKLHDRKVDAATQEAMLEALALLEQELYDKTPPPLTIGDMGVQIAMTVNQKNKIIRKYRQAKDPFSLKEEGGVCPLCKKNKANNKQLVLLGCNHLYHSNCYDKFVEAQKGKSTQIGCVGCKDEIGTKIGNLLNRLPNILVIFTYKMRGAAQLREIRPMKGRAQYVNGDILDYLKEAGVPEHIWKEVAEEMEQRKKAKQQEEQKKVEQIDPELQRIREQRKKDREAAKRRKAFDAREKEKKMAAKKGGKQS